MRSAALAILVLSGCSAAAPPRPTVPCVLEAPGDEARLGVLIEQASGELPIEVSVVPLPVAPAVATRTSFDFASLRTAYDDGDLERCVASAPDDTLVVEWLRARQRDDASRGLFWRMACLRALGRTAEAEAAANEHAARALPLPADVGAANAIAEALLRDAHRRTAELPRVGLTIEADPVGATLEIDGAERPERAPTTLELAPGPHLVRITSPTFAVHEVSVELRAGEPASLEVALTRAQPADALADVAERRAISSSLDEDVSLALLTVALRTRAFVLVSRDADRTRASLVTLADDAEHAEIVRAERVGAAQWDLQALLSDVLVRGELMARPRELYELPELWIAIGAAVLVGVGVTIAATLPPDVRTRVTW